MKSKTNKQAINSLLKEFNKQPYELGYGLLRERLLCIAELSKKDLSDNPERWNNPFISTGIYREFFDLVIDKLKFDE